jgi:CRISPR/Cas system-associated exonuclease Cas4 (RecB family)
MPGFPTYGPIMTAWTYSSLDKYLTCPKQYYHLRIVRDVKEPPSEQTIWGEKVHKALEDFIQHSKKLPDDMSHWTGFMEKIRRLNGTKHTEMKLSVDVNFQPCEWDHAWSRGIVDLLVINKDTALVVDYKTGKRKPSDQLSLYAAYVFAHYPEVNTVTTAFVWLKDRKVDKETFTRDDIAAIWQRFLPVVTKINASLDTNKWPARPSGLCRQWCYVLTCEHNGRKTIK